MVTTKFKGRLANNMFQIGAAMSLAKNNNDISKFNRSSINNYQKYSNNILRNIPVGNVNFNEFKNYKQPTFAYHEIKYNENICLEGFFQSEKYLDRELMLEVFSVDQETYNKLNEKYSDVLEHKTVSLHVRRGDYVRLPHFPLQPMEYYDEALKHFNNEHEVLVFSDDMEWCKDNFPDHFHFMDSNKDYEDIWLMSMCDHNIIANSSFSWWGAYLNDNPNKIVVTPQKWFGGKNKNMDISDLIPEDWIKI